MTSLISALNGVFVPLSIIIGITSVFGLLGNGLAFYIFCFRFPPSGFNTLMAALAIYDIIACVVHMPLDIITFFEIGYIRTYLCKITCFQLAFTATGTAMILIAVAVIRFYGIHKPLLGIISPKPIYYVILVSALMAIGLSLPITILFGAGELKTDNNLTAGICAVEPKYMDSFWPIAFYLLLASLYGVTFIAHTCMYIKSVHTLWNRRRVFVSMRGRNNVVMLSPTCQRSATTSEQLRTRRKPLTTSTGHRSAVSQRELISEGEAAVSQDSSGRDEASPSPVPFPRSLKPQPLNAAPQDTESVAVDKDEPVATSGGDNRPRRPKPKLRLQRLSKLKTKTNTTTTAATTTTTTTTTHTSVSSIVAARRLGAGRGRAGLGGGGGGGRGGGSMVGVQQNTYKILGVVVAISLTYFLSYAPHFGVMFYLFSHDMTVFQASAQNLTFELLMRSFFLNNILDPVIYGLFSADFRKEAKLTLLRPFGLCSMSKR